MVKGHHTGGSDEDPPPRRRRCFRRGCEERFAPPAWSERFCGTPACRAELRRWAAGEVVSGAREAGDYGVRRCARPGCVVEFVARSPTHRYCASCRPCVTREQARDRGSRRRLRAKTEASQGERAEQARPGRPARRRRHASVDLCQSLGRCQRPGCYEPRRDSPRRRSLYCGAECARAVRRVLDRERKWRLRALARSEPRRSAVIERPPSSD